MQLKTKKSPAEGPGEGRGGVEAPKDFTKVRQISQSPKRLYKAPTDYTKPRKLYKTLEYLTKPQNNKHIPKIFNQSHNNT